MEKFNHAFKHFKKTGCFVLEDAPLTLSQLCELQAYIKKNIILSDKVISYQFSLKDVELIYGYTSPSSKIQKPTISGALTDEEHPQWGRQFVLGQWDEVPCFSDTLPFEEQKLKLEKALLDALLNSPSIWNIIRIERIYFSDKKQLSDEFSSALLKDLRNHTDGFQKSSLEVLTLKDIVIDPIELSALIKISHSLKLLQLKTNSSHRYFLQDFLPSLYLHPSLETLELLGQQLSISDYSFLHQLFDNNYHIKQLLLEKPSADAITREQHKNLLLRLSQENEQRFKYEQLNQKKFLAMARKAMVDKNSKQLDVLLKQPNSLLSIRSGEGKTLSEVYQVLPDIYIWWISHLYGKIMATSLPQFKYTLYRRKNNGGTFVRTSL